MTTNQRPPYHWGIIAPARGDEAGETDGRTESLLPPEVITLSNVLGIQDYTSEGVEEAIVVAVDDEEWGQRPVAFVRMADQQKVHLRRFEEELREVLPGYMIPKAVLPWPDDLVASGIKPSRAELTRRARGA